MQICGFLAVLPLQSLLYAYLPAQVPDLRVKSWQRVPRGAKNKQTKKKKTVRNDNIWVSLFHTANEPFRALDQAAAAPTVQTLMQFSHVSPPCSRYSDATRNISSPVVLSGNALQNRKFSLMAAPSKAHWPKVEHSHYRP